MTYTTIQHPVSGETYAVELGPEGQLARAAGPLHHTDATDADSLRAWIDNQPGDDAREDAAWLRGQLEDSRNR